VFVPFFHRLAHTPVGPVVMAMKTRAPIVPMAIQRRPDDTHLITIKPALKMRYTDNYEADVLHNSRACNAALEAFIRQCPAQWVWMHNRWRKRPSEGDRTAWRELVHVTS
jgi:KDO2-lipid IV(A) lauroyltransferase